MSLQVNISESRGDSRAAVAAHLAVHDCEALLLLEVDGIGAGPSVLLNAAFGALSASLASPITGSSHRWLDAALLAANIAVCEAAARNPSMSGMLVSASAAVCRKGQANYASVGANGVFLRTASSTVTLASPENVAHRLGRSDPAGIAQAPRDERLRKPVAGLGLSPQLFEVRQSGSVDLADGDEIVLCGAAVMDHITLAHLESIPARGASYNTAHRIHRFVESRLSAGSAVLSARFKPAASLPAADDILIESVSEPRSRKRLVVIALLLLGAVAVSLALFFGHGEDSAPPPAVPPDLQLAPKRGP